MAAATRFFEDAVIEAQFLAMNPAPTLALVDFASLLGGPSSASAYEDAAELLWSIVVNSVSPRKTDDAIFEVTCRLYGGWNATNGTPTEHRTWMVRSLKTLRGLRDGVRMVPTIADGLAIAPEVRLDGTYKNGGQKMVDQMLSMDALSSIRGGDHTSLLIVSDDDDFTPVVITISLEAVGWVCWVRQRAAGANDHHCSNARVEFLMDPIWT